MKEFQWYSPVPLSQGHGVIMPYEKLQVKHLVQAS